MKLETRTTLVNGSKVRCLHGGKGKPLLFLHGWPSQPPAYMEALELLAESFTVYAPYMFDLKCGSVKETAEGVKALIRQLGVKAPAVVGNSFGGAVVAAIGQNAKAVSQLILIGPGGVPRKASLVKMLTNLMRSSVQLIVQGHRQTAFYRWASMFSFLASLCRHHTRQLFREIRASTKTHCCWLFQGIKAKTAIIWCSKDDVFPVSAAAVLNKMIRNSTLTIVDEDHYWPFHKPGEFAETILAHVK
ncbi:alpha/beta hydrolase [Candidatus Woesearchaeota archaeon]|nr:alpha/beta hydrolase [Candidatus Woesearchaeota archaeon]